MTLNHIFIHTEKYYTKMGVLGALPPSEIGNLADLTELHLTRNQLVSLPSEIRFLAELKCLYLAYNKLTCLPVEIKLLVKLEVLKTDYNPLQEALPLEESFF